MRVAGTWLSPSRAEVCRDILADRVGVVTLTCDL